MSLIGLTTAGLKAAVRALERVEAPHGPWCESSRDWSPETPDSRIVPIRIGDEFIGKMFQEDGWAADIAAVFMRPTGDGTFQMYFREADSDSVDHSANRTVQRMVLTALDLAQALEMSNCDLPEYVVDALAEFKKASRSRLSSAS